MQVKAFAWSKAQGSVTVCAKHTLFSSQFGVVPFVCDLDTQNCFVQPLVCIALVLLSNCLWDRNPYDLTKSGGTKDRSAQKLVVEKPKDKTWKNSRKIEVESQVESGKKH